MGEDAFSKCGKLERFDVGISSPVVTSYDGMIYGDNGKELIFCPEGRTGEAVIPDGVKSIKDYALCGRERITGASLAGSVRKTGAAQFADCGALTSGIINEGVAERGKHCFNNCPLLETAVIPDSVKTFGGGAFLNCPKLKIFCKAGSEAERYAKKNGIPYETK